MKRMLRGFARCWSVCPEVRIVGVGEWPHLLRIVIVIDGERPSCYERGVTLSEYPSSGALCPTSSKFATPGETSFRVFASSSDRAISPAPQWLGCTRLPAVPGDIGVRYHPALPCRVIGRRRRRTLRRCRWRGGRGCGGPGRSASSCADRRATRRLGRHAAGRRHPTRR